MTTIKPATPLPWRFEQHNGDRPQVYRGNPSYQPAYIYSGKTHICGFQHMPNDAAYIVHACNSLPRVIAELHKLAPIIDRFWAEEPDNSVLTQRRDELRDLLVDLGELK